MWECYKLNFMDGKLRTHSSRVIFSRMQNNLGHNYVNTRADHCSQMLPGYSTLLLTHIYLLPVLAEQETKPADK